MSKMNHVNTYEEVIESFRVFDKSGSGQMATNELRDILTELGEPMDPTELDELLYEADGGTGTVNYEEFVNRMYAFD